MNELQEKTVKCVSCGKRYIPEGEQKIKLCHDCVYAEIMQLFNNGD